MPDYYLFICNISCSTAKLYVCSFPPTEAIAECIASRNSSWTNLINDSDVFNNTNITEDLRDRCANITVVITKSSTAILEVCGECYGPEYVVFTWILCLVALTSILKLQYLVKTFLALANCSMYCVLLLRYYNIYFSNITQNNDRYVASYVVTLILMQVFKSLLTPLLCQASNWQLI